MLIIGKEEQENLIDMKEVLVYVEKALIAFSNNETQTPIRTALSFDGEENTALFMPSAADKLKSLGIKVVNVVPGNKSKNKKTINGIVMLFDMETGEPKALLEGSHITQIRTGALSGIATKYLARKDARILGVIGTGEQAKGLCKAICTVRKIEKVILYNRSQDKAKKFASYIEEKFGVAADVVLNANRVVEQSDILVTATNATDPVYSAVLKKGTHVNAVGSFRPSMQETPSSSITNADKVIVESKEAALEESGDLQKPIEKGFPSDQLVELGDILRGNKEGRMNEEEITVFKSVGLAVVDIIVGQYVLEQVQKNRRG
ncbi:ornithine cyclodeaminase family protein [Virgibacillus sp. CBA3643]|uniref:ornithine cyclodeaminase family protein n=1 Tax=Virgibacillus sp. CBA3643 TaxID=2942278 RepID=UPI0035A2C54A